MYIGHIGNMGIENILCVKIYTMYAYIGILIAIYIKEG